VVVWPGGYGFVVNVGQTDCDAAADIVLFAAEILDQVVDTIQADGRRADLAITALVLDPAEFRWQVERALDARAVHAAAARMRAAESVPDIPGVVALKARNPRAVTWAEEEP
jgi:hypothetical protein